VFFSVVNYFIEFKCRLLEHQYIIFDQVTFMTGSMGGLVVKQILHKAKEEKLDKLVNNTAGVVCINASCLSGFLLS